MRKLVIQAPSSIILNFASLAGFSRLLRICGLYFFTVLNCEIRLTPRGLKSLFLFFYTKLYLIFLFHFLYSIYLFIYFYSWLSITHSGFLCIVFLFFILRVSVFYLTMKIQVFDFSLGTFGKGFSKFKLGSCAIIPQPEYTHMHTHTHTLHHTSRSCKTFVYIDILLCEITRRKFTKCVSEFPSRLYNIYVERTWLISNFFNFPPIYSI